MKVLKNKTLEKQSNQTCLGIGDGTGPSDSCESRDPKSLGNGIMYSAGAFSHVIWVTQPFQDHPVMPSNTSTYSGILLFSGQIMGRGIPSFTMGRTFFFFVLLPEHVNYLFSFTPNDCKRKTLGFISVFKACNMYPSDFKLIYPYFDLIVCTFSAYPATEKPDLKLENIRLSFCRHQGNSILSICM